MNRRFSLAIVVMLALSGCGKQDETAPAATESGSKVAAAAEKVAAEAVDVAKTAVAEVAKEIDWSSLTWDKVDQIPYTNKTQLADWAGVQVGNLKDKLAKAALQKGMQGLGSLDSSGWQGTLKTVVSAVDQVRQSSPETWEMARGALVSAWDAFQAEAAKFLGQG